MDRLLLDLAEQLSKRATGLQAQLEADNPECFEDQRHTDAGTQERVYWHYGYLVAVKDVLALLNGPAAPSN